MLVSIVVPVYNAENCLSRCVDSILIQTYKAIEVFLVDDGSADTSASLCDRYALADSRVKVCHQVNGGPSAARNTGISMASGAYLMFVDADDYIDPAMVETLVRTIEAEQLDLAVCTYKSHLFRKGQELSANSFVLNAEKMSAGDFFSLATLDIENAQSVRARAHVAGNVWGRLYRADIVRDKGLKFDTGLTRYEDVLFNTCYLGQIDTLQIVNSNLYHYCVATDQASLSDRVTKNKFAMLTASYEAIDRALAGKRFDYVKYLYSYIIMGHLIRLFQADSPYSFPDALAEVKAVCRSRMYEEVMRYYHVPKGASVLIPFFLKRKWFLFASIAAKARMVRASLGNKPVRQWCFSS